MNKRNFGRVIKRIEADPDSWNQSIPPFCGSAFCFLGHARVLFSPRSHKYGTRHNKALQKALGLSPDEMWRVWQSNNTLADFKRWHKLGRVE